MSRVVIRTHQEPTSEPRLGRYIDLLAWLDRESETPEEFCYADEEVALGEVDTWGGSSLARIQVRRSFDKGGSDELLHITGVGCAGG